MKALAFLYPFCLVGHPKVSQSEKVSPDFTIVPSRVLQAKFIFEYLALVSLGSLVEKLEIVLFFEDLFCFFSFDVLVLL